MKIIISIMISLVIAGLLYKQFPYAISKDDDIADLILNLLKLTLFISSLFFIVKTSKLQEKAFMVISWIMIFCLIIAIYSYKDDILASKFMSNILPSYAVKQKNGSLMYAADANGHFQIETIMNGNKILCMVDSGATSIVIDSYIARNLGFQIESLKFNIPVNTANGLIYTASSKLETMSVGNLNYQDIQIAVNPTDDEMCLLGVSFLNLFNNIEFKKRSLILTP